ncbi:hypothetical protein SAMN02745823_00489 [Sporobacter termitidis DSM 10068]|uniref:Uncharacterized protein n=1 Tax=Sporobacter termitidis DSM 10068 TaxID=1123282 RepID=A0A1M5UFG9_9FIRM|nr:hypothetical protein [Sporobacter termitidis]SHH61576.1 hypothetical protein SAMN02745823_00489 [Sporobacter termitidis DSM 10068]
MSKHRDPKQKRFALAIVVLIAVALLFLSSCAYYVTPNSVAPPTVIPLSAADGSYDTIH